MIVIDCEQGTPQWHAHRCGKVTGSRVCDIVRKTGKDGISKMRETYKGELVAERLSGFQAEGGFLSKAVQWGKETEARARDTYEFRFNAEVTRVGLVIHPTLLMAAASPDSLVDDDGLLEVKCPNSATHIETLLGGVIEPDYFKQMQWGLACTGRQWCDFLSFDPRFPLEMQMSVTRVHRDSALIADLERAVEIFLRELDKTVEDLRARFALEAA